MFERFTEAARSAVLTARVEAEELGAPSLDAGHLLLGVLSDPKGAAATVLRELDVDIEAVRAQLRSAGPADAEALRTLGIDLEEVRRRAEASFGPGALDRPRRQRSGLFGRRSASAHLPLSKEARSALELSLRAALARHDRFIGTEHLLLGLLHTDRGSALRLLHSAGLGQDRAALEDRIAEALRRAA
jgi:ATP-dependent Clp protease ATP-binding subunit ClpA